MAGLKIQLILGLLIDCREVRPQSRLGYGLCIVVVIFRPFRNGFT